MGMRKTCWAGPAGVPFEVPMAVSRLRWLCFLFLLSLAVGAGSKKDEKKKKSVLDLSERDVHRIYEQWEENDEDSDDDDYDDFDPRKRPSGPSIDIEKLQSGGKIDPQQILEQSKKGKPLMIFVGVKSPPNEQYTDQVSRLWAQSLMNAHIPVERYVVGTDRVLFMTRDGSMAWKIKDYLVTLEECTTVNFEHLSFPCKGTEGGSDGYQHPKQEL